RAEGQQRTRSHAFGTNETISVQESGDMILEGSAALKIRVLRSLEEQRPQADWHGSPQQALTEASRHLQLAFLLGLPYRPPAFPLPTWQAVGNPFSFTAVSSWNYPFGPTIPPPR